MAQAGSGEYCPHMSSGSPEIGHVPVLMSAVLEALEPASGETCIDCTAGRGGHARALAERVGATGRVVVNDADPANARFAASRVEGIDEPPALSVWEGNFVDVPRRAAEEGVRADVVLADLGFASSQMEDASRGLSFQREGPLDMRFDPSGPVTAGQLVNTLPEPELAEILRDFGEERAARRIARKLVAEREVAPIDTTARLASIVSQVIGPRGGGQRLHPATRTFQALRIAVNDEIGCLRSLMEGVARGATLLRNNPEHAGWLAPGARVGIISFHSLEDRVVKRAFGELAERGLGTVMTKRPIEADDSERERNPRARSARLRAIRLAVR